MRKKNKDLRVCLDPQDLNKVIKEENHMIPSFEQFAVKLNNKRFFSVLDLKEGYWQIKLNESSSKLCTFSTPFGCYRFLRLPFGIKIAPEIFQKYNEKNFKDIPGVTIYIDDVLIAANSLEEHDRILGEVFKRARELNIKFNPTKFQYRINKVKYLGHIMSGEGISCDPDRIVAIQKIEPPKDKNDLQKLLGMINYVRSFIPNLAEICQPLRELLKKNIEFIWLPIHTECLSKIKNIICNAPTLKTFDINKEITIEADASKFGLGCCLMQEGKPISFASRSLSDTEVRYAQIEKEFLAVVFACQKFHYYIYGRQVLVRSDHKPLVHIMQKDLLTIPSARLQRMKLRLSKYMINLTYVPGKYLYVADLLSRYFNKEEKLVEIEDLNELVHTINVSDEKKAEFKAEIEKDPQLNKLKRVIIDGWPNDKNKINEIIRFYYKFKNELFVEDDLIFLNERIIVPRALQKYILKLLHRPHLGIEKTRTRAKSLVYWPQLNADIENMIIKCSSCQKYRSSNIKEPMISHKVPNYSYQKIGMDIFEYENKNYLVVSDYYSRFLDILPLRNKTANEVVNKLKVNCFAIHGIPREVVTDNVPFNSFYFKNFCIDNDIKLTTISPTYSQANGFAEKAVNISKNILKKCNEEKIELWSALLEYRNMPLKEINASPCELLMSRKTRTLIPARSDLFMPRIVPNINENIKFKNAKQKFYYDKNSKVKNKFDKGEKIWLKDIKKGWIKASISSVDSNPRSYWIQLENGTVLRRNSSVLRTRRCE